MKEQIRNCGLKTGFDRVAFCPARRFPEHMALLSWLAQGNHGTMQWMERSQEKRTDPLQVMPEAKTVIVCALNYNSDYPYSINMGGSLPHPPKIMADVAPSPQTPFAQTGKAGSSLTQNSAHGWIARYAWGEDYHPVMERMLQKFSQEILRVTGHERRATCYVDSGPVMERVFAANSGIGWIGKNTCVIHPKLGSWFFLGVILTDLAIEPDQPILDHCGTCTACIDACPTAAITEPHKIDARKCISYLTIEHRGEIAPELAAQMGHHIFGCDLCQDVCPWNRKAPKTSLPAFQPRDGFYHPKLADFLVKVEQTYPHGFKNSPLKRAKKAGLLRNIRIAEQNAHGSNGKKKTGDGIF